ncbi:MAG: esterase-like activity of phytase family protein [Nitrosomonadaceae bacterium]
MTFLSFVSPLAQSQVPTLSYLGQSIVPSGTQFGGTLVGGLSSIDYVPASGHYLAVSDDRSANNPARFYELSLDLSKFQRSPEPGDEGVTFIAVTTLQTQNGGPFERNMVDPEGLRYDGSRNKIYWVNEGQRSRFGYRGPTVREMNPDGSHVRDFRVPDHYHPSGSRSGLRTGDRGIHDNLSLESLALSIDGKTLYTATENGLSQDSPPSGVGNGSSARILSFDIATGLPGEEYLYPVERVATPPILPGLFSTNGLTDMVAIGDRQFISIERSYAIGAQTRGSITTGKTVRLFYIDARGASDISGLESISGHTVKAVDKILIVDLSDLKNDDGSSLALDNIEGITLGPIFEGKSTVILVSDNNFSRHQFTQFIALVMSNRTPD